MAHSDGWPPSPPNRQMARPGHSPRRRATVPSAWEWENMPIIDATGEPEIAPRVAPGRRRAAAGFEDLLHAAPEALLVVDTDGVVVEANRRAELVFRVEPDALAGRPAGDVLPASPSLPADIIGSGAEVVARRADGTEFPVEISVNALGCAAGHEVLVTVRDVTARKRTEEA